MLLVNRIIWPTATYVGFRKVGFNPILSFTAIFVIHGTFSFASQDGWLPDLRMPIYVKNIHRTKHGSDSEVYDTEGRFVPVNPCFLSDEVPSVSLMESRVVGCIYRGIDVTFGHH